MVALDEKIVEAVLDTFDGLPARFKPQGRGNGIQEWVPLSGIVITRGMICHQSSNARISSDETLRKGDHEPTCISLA